MHKKHSTYILQKNIRLNLILNFLDSTDLFEIWDLAEYVWKKP